MEDTEEGKLSQFLVAVRRGGDAAELARAFESELARGRVREGGEIRAVAAPSSSANSLGSELASALRTAPMPPLLRTLRARARAGDEPVLLDDEGSVLLAVRRAGAGPTATLASMFSTEWAPAWRDAIEQFAPVLRALARTRAGEPRPRATIEDGRLRIRDVPGDWPPAFDARAYDVAASAEGTELGRARLALPVCSIDVDPRSVRDGEWTAAASPSSGAARLELSADRGWHATLTLVAPRAAAFDGPPRRVADLVGVAASSDPTGERPRPHPAGPWLLGLGLAMLAAAGVLGATRS